MGANWSKKVIEPALSRADPGTNIIDVGAVKSWLLCLIEESVRGQSKPTNKQASGAHLHKMLTKVSGISFVSMRGAWQKNSFFLIGHFKRLLRIIGRAACLILVDNPCRVGRTNETYAWYRSNGDLVSKGIALTARTSALQASLSI